MITCKCLIVEDSPQFSNLVVEYLSRIPYMTEPVVVTTVTEALVMLQQPFDLIVLDMQLPDQDGLELLKAFPQLPPVIITTASPDFAVECYDFEVADYLLKPFTFTRFLRAVNRAVGGKVVNPSRIPEDSIFLKVGHFVQRFDLSDIDYIQAYGIYCKVVCGNKLTVVNEAISTLENMLPSSMFMRVHKSYVLNIKRISTYSHRTIHVGTVEIPLGLAYRDKFRTLLGLDKGQD